MCCPLVVVRCKLQKQSKVSTSDQQQTGDQRQVYRNSDLYLTVTLELTFQPLTAGLSVPQSLRKDPQLGCNCNLLLCRLLQLGNTPDLISSLRRWLILGQRLAYLLVELLDLTHAALQVRVELDPLCLQPTQQLISPPPTSWDQHFLPHKQTGHKHSVLSPSSLFRV